MRTYEEVEEATHSDTEITLGMRSILGIFFALALVCGVFFGFGYSLGRGNPARTAAPVQIASPSPEADTETPLPVKTVVEQPAQSIADTPARKPSGAIAESDSAETASAAPRQAVATAVSEPISAAPRPIAPTAAALVTSSANPPHASVAASTDAATDQAASIMVQIAAVSRRQDADVLVSALGKLGYRASVNPAAADNLLHVQIGPFTTRDEAKAMRTKLLNDGYNAILK